MLTKEELRVGNYIIGKTVDGFRDINERILDPPTPGGIATSPFSVRSTGRGYELVQEIDTRITLPYAWANGILIDENWLEGLGFKRSNSDYQTYSKGDMTVRLVAGECLVYYQQMPIDQPIKFIHELQNTYADLARNLLTLPEGKTKPSLKEGFE